MTTHKDQSHYTDRANNILDLTNKRTRLKIVAELLEAKDKLEQRVEVLMTRLDQYGLLPVRSWEINDEENQ